MVFTKYRNMNAIFEQIKKLDTYSLLQMNIMVQELILSRHEATLNMTLDEYQEFPETEEELDLISNPKSILDMTLEEYQELKGIPEMEEESDSAPFTGTKQELDNELDQLRIIRHVLQKEAKYCELRFQNACRKGDLKTINSLLDNGMNPSADDGWAICWASAYGHVDLVHRLLADKRVDPACRYNGPIRFASASGQH